MDRSAPNSAARFSTTHWSLVLVAARQNAALGGPELEDLCRAYWAPLYAFARHSGLAPEAAQDVTQETFARLLNGDGLLRADPAQGRFRSYLLGCLKNTMAMDDRAMNIQNALADRQAIFKGDCARCHLDKGVGKMGAELYLASCGICHEAEHRAAMVPDLKVPRSPRDLAFWQKWIAEGKPATLMPAFAATHGDPLTQEQADSLTVYLYQNFPRNPPMVLTTPPISTAASR